MAIRFPRVARNLARPARAHAIGAVSARRRGLRLPRMHETPETSPYERWLRYFGDRHGEELYAPLEEPFVERPGARRSLAPWPASSWGSRGTAPTSGRSRGPPAIPPTPARSSSSSPRRTRTPTGSGCCEAASAESSSTSHWSDNAFVLLRHVGGLRREICVLLTAELVALTYYRVLPLAYEDPVLAAACKRILRDERGHVAFHRATLSREFSGMPAPARSAAILSWRSFVATTAAVVAWDHREVLELAGVAAPSSPPRSARTPGASPARSARRTCSARSRRSRSAPADPREYGPGPGDQEARWTTRRSATRHDGHVTVLTYARPEQRNAVSRKMNAELHHAWQRFRDDPRRVRPGDHRRGRRLLRRLGPRRTRPSWGRASRPTGTSSRPASSTPPASAATRARWTSSSR